MRSFAEKGENEKIVIYISALCTVLVVRGKRVSFNPVVVLF